jgi:hypothetical protein
MRVVDGSGARLFFPCTTEGPWVVICSWSCKALTLFLFGC